MSKRNLKSLQLNKKSISNLNAHEVNGGLLRTAICQTLLCRRTGKKGCGL
ncbi:hypothetical protein [uncultured Kordia sp.]|nr:hypothetical protein [uncultured Kordia sp.]